MSKVSGHFACAACGAKYKWKQTQAGKRVTCKCGSKIQVPATQPHTSSAPAPVPTKTCPGCQASAPTDAVLCMDCGALFVAPETTTDKTKRKRSNKKKRWATSNSATSSAAKSNHTATDATSQPLDFSRIHEAPKVKPSRRNFVIPVWVVRFRKAIMFAIMLAVISIYRFFVPLDPYVAPPNSGTQKIEIEDITFLNFDAQTKLDDVHIEMHSEFKAKDIMIRPDSDSSMFAISANPGTWIFVWQGEGPTNAIEGLAVDTQELTLGNKQFFDEPNAIGFDATLAKTRFRDKQHLFATKEALNIYIATVDHPTDAESKERAIAFIEQAIQRGRSVYHARRLMALMRALDQGDQEVTSNWLSWLKSIATRSAASIAQESDTARDDANHLMRLKRATSIQFEAIITLAMLSDFEQIEQAKTQLQSGNIELPMMFGHLFAGRGVSDQVKQQYIELANTVTSIPLRQKMLRPINGYVGAKNIERFLADAKTPAQVLGITFTEQLKVLQPIASDEKTTPHLQQLLSTAIDNLHTVEPASERWPVLMTIALEVNPKVFISSLLQQTESQHPQITTQMFSDRLSNTNKPLTNVDSYYAHLWCQLHIKTSAIGVDHTSGVPVLTGNPSPQTRAMFQTLAKHKDQIARLYQHYGSQGVGQVVQALAKTYAPKQFTQLKKIADEKERIAKLASQAKAANDAEKNRIASMRGNRKALYGELGKQVEKGNVQAVKVLLEMMAPVNGSGVARPTVLPPLYRAALNRNYQLVRLLIDHGAHIYQHCSTKVGPRQTYGYNALSVVMETGPDDLIKLMIDKSISLYRKVNSWHALKQAAYLGKTEIMNYVLAHPKFAADYSNGLLLVAAAQFGDVALFEKLKTQGAAINDKNRVTFFLKAIEGGNLDLVKSVMKDIKIDARYPTTVGNTKTTHTPVQWAMLNDKPTIVSLLLSAGATYETKGPFTFQKTARATVATRILFDAIHYGSYNVAQWAIARGANIHFNNINQSSSLIEQFALSTPSLTKAQWLLDRGASVSRRRPNSQSLLERFRKSNRTDDMATLVASHYQRRKLPTTSPTVLRYLASASTESKKLKKVLDDGFSINAIADAATGETLLHIAVQARNFDGVQLLLGYRPDLSIKDRSNKFPTHSLHNLSDFRVSTVKRLIDMHLANH